MLGLLTSQLIFFYAIFVCKKLMLLVSLASKWHLNYVIIYNLWTYSCKSRSRLCARLFFG